MSGSEGDSLRLAEIVTRYRYGGMHEAELQEQLAEVLRMNAVVAEREVELGDRNRIDLQSGTTGIEVKVEGTLPQALRQVARYLQCAQLEGVLLISTRPWAAEYPGEVHALFGKHVRVVRVHRSI